MLVSPFRNHSSSWMMDLRCTLLVVSSGKPAFEVEPQLRAEDAERAGAGAVVLARAVLEHVPHQVEVGAHR